MSTVLLHPRLADCRRLFLRDYEVHINIGVHDFEKRGEQRVVINDFMRSTVAERVGKGHIHLQETLCDDLAAALLSHEQVRAVRVSTEKPDVYPDCDAVGVEVFRIKED